MCIIAISPKGTDKYSGFFEEALRNSAVVHKDGMGYAFKKTHNQALYFHKGFMNVDRLIESIKNHKLKNDDELIVHFRFKSAGIVCAENCHPFILTPDDDQINDVGPSTTIHPIMFHNGTVIDFSLDRENSDTYHFAKRFMRLKDMYGLMKTDKDKFRQMFGHIVGFNKFAFLFPKTTAPLVTYGENWVTDNGYTFSNQSYTNSRATHTPKVIGIDGSQRHYVEGEFSRVPINIHKNSVKNRLQRIESLKRQKYQLFDDYELSKDNPKIKLNEDNYDELVFIAKTDLETLNIKKGEKYLINEWSTQKSQRLQQFQDQNIFYWVSTSCIDSDFDIVPKSSYQDKYHDYYKLTKTIKPTKSSIKKVFRTMNRFSAGKNKKGGDFLLNLKYKNMYIQDVRLDAVKMFIMDHFHFVENSILTNG